MINFLARFSPGLQAMLALPREVADLIVVLEDVLHDKGHDPKVQKALNQMRDLGRKLETMQGS